MTNFKLIIEYDGTDFHGWQIQPEVRTVEGVLERAVRELVGQPVTINGCCRTDAGVHAWGFVGSLEVETRLTPEQLRRALGGKLPDDIVVKHAEEAPPGFHARHSCIARRYLYQIATARTAVHRRVLSYTRYALDVDRMADGADYLLGEHDFTSFAPASLEKGLSPVCSVLAASFRSEDAIISFDIKADRFLHHMVRNIVGTLMEVGRGRFNPEQIEEILRKKDRRVAGPTAPACGLALMEAYYPE
jgi:tRNA pseudouridine38-40 synthase